MKVPRQCPFVLLVKVGWGGGKKFVVKKVETKSGAGREVEEVSTAPNHNPEFRH
jgi:hypothetical protein